MSTPCHDNRGAPRKTSRGWSSTGKELYGLQRLVWTGKTPFEMKTVRAMPDGFEIEYTLPIDKKLAADPSAYKVTGFNYKYQAAYGSPVINNEKCAVRAVVVSEDGLKARLVVDGLREGYIHEITAVGVRTADGKPLLHQVGLGGRRAALAEGGLPQVEIQTFGSPNAGRIGLVADGRLSLLRRRTPVRLPIIPPRAAAPVPLVTVAVDDPGAIEAAEAFMRDDVQALPEGLKSRDVIHQALVQALPGGDHFWPRWIVWSDSREATTAGEGLA